MTKKKKQKKLKKLKKKTVNFYDQYKLSIKKLKEFRQHKISVSEDMSRADKIRAFMQLSIKQRLAKMFVRTDRKPPS
jgi:hypothetical protein